MHHVIASHFGLTHQQVMDLHARGYSYEDIATAANLAARSGRPLADVVAMRDRQMEWPAIASSYSLTEADVSRPFYRYTGPEAVVYEYNHYQVSTGIPATDYERYRKMGYSARDISMAYNVAQRTGRQPDEIFRSLDRGMTWDAIAREHNLTLTDIQTPQMRVAGARSTMAAGQSPYAMANNEVNWSRAYELTPSEMKRLRAKGLRDSEIFLAANAARLSGRPVDDVVQMIFRGQTAPQIARQLNVSETALDDKRPEWQTPEWEQAVREGLWYTPRPGTTMGTTGGSTGMATP
jgi:DNA-binding CsgD family transcriptional regulator